MDISYNSVSIEVIINHKLLNITDTRPIVMMSKICKRYRVRVKKIEHEDIKPEKKVIINKRKPNKILDKVFTPDIDKITSEQDIIKLWMLT